MDLDKLLMLNYVHVVHIVPSKEGGHKMNIRFKALPPSPSQPAQYTGKEQVNCLFVHEPKLTNCQNISSGCEFPINHQCN